jgi:hypothetical protein
MKTFDAAVAIIVVATLALTCSGRDSKTPVSAVSSSPTASAPTIEEELAAFRSGMTVRPRALEGATSRDSLVRLFERALARRDTAALKRLQLTREEFAYLYYPDSKMARPPYELGPDMMWIQIESQSNRGLQRLLARQGGRKLGIRALDCQPPERQSAVVIHQCGVRTNGATDTTVKQLFGSIIERDGRFKFVGYANRL